MIINNRSVEIGIKYYDKSQFSNTFDVIYSVGGLWTQINGNTTNNLNLLLREIKENIADIWPQRFLMGNSQIHKLSEQQL